MSTGLRRGVWFAGELRTRRMMELATAAETAGLNSVWMAEGYYARDAFTPLAAIATVTERIELATGVVNPYTRHPAVLAMSFATLDELSGGRAVVGLGAGARHQVQGEMGYEASRPLSGVREAVDIIEKMVIGDVVRHRGQVFTADGVRLTVSGARKKLPVYLAAVGAKMCAMAGERADGVYLPQASPSFVRRAVSWVGDGATRAGRDLSGIDVAAMIILAVNDDLATARNETRALLGLLLLAPESEGLVEQNGLDPAAVSDLRQRFSTGGMRALWQGVTDDMVDTLTICGPPSRCRDRLDELVAAGVTHPVGSLMGSSPEQAIEVLAALH